MARIELNSKELSALRNRAIQTVNKKEGDFGDRNTILNRLREEQRQKLGFNDIRGTTTAENKKRSKLSRIASQRARNELNELIARREQKIENAIRPLRSEALVKKRKVQRAFEQKRGIQLSRSEDQRSVAKRATSQRDIELQTSRPSRRSLIGGVNLSRDQRDTLSRLEAEEQVGIQSDPARQSSFDQVNEFLLGITDEDIDRFEREAADQFDDYFDEQRGFVNEALQNKISDLNQNFNFLNKQEEFTLQQKVKRLDKDASKILSDNLDTLQERGLLSGGSLRRFATSVIEARAEDLLSAEKFKEFALEGADIKRGQGLRDAEFTARKDLSDLEQRQREAEMTEVQRLADLESARQLEFQRASGAENVRQPGTQTGLERAQAQVAATDAGAARISQINPQAAPSFTATRAPASRTPARRAPITSAEIRRQSRTPAPSGLSRLQSNANRRRAERKAARNL